MPELKHAVLTGPIHRAVTLSDGTEVDARPYVVYVDTPEQATELAHLIGEHYADKGHPHHDDDKPFTYEAPEG